MRFWTTSVGYNENDEPEYWLTAHQMPTRSWCYWQARKWVTWTPDRWVQKIPALHAWWVDHMEIPCSLALEVRHADVMVHITAGHYAILTRKDSGPFPRNPVDPGVQT